MKFFTPRYFHVATCGPRSISDGEISYDRDSVNGRYPVNTTVTFMCNPGFSLSGESSSICQETARWNTLDPTCDPGEEMFILFCFPHAICKNKQFVSKT